MADEATQPPAEQGAAGPGAPGQPVEMTPTAQWSHYNRYIFLLSKLLFYGVIIGATIFVMHALGAVLFPIFVSMLIAYLLDPGIDWFEERGVNRTVGILVYIVVGGIAAAGVVLFLYPTIARLILSLVHKAPRVVQMVQQEQIPWMEQTFNIQFPPTVRDALNEYGGQIQGAIPGVAKQVGGWITDLLTQTGALMSSLLNLVMIPVFSFYFLRDFDRMKGSAVVLLPAFRRDFLLSRLRLMDSVVGAWFRGQLQVAGILGVLYSMGLTAVFAAVGIEWTSGVAVGIVVGVLSIIPYFGVLIGIVLTALIVFIEWSGPGAVAGVAVVFLIVQLLEGYIITPKIVGEKVGLSPVSVIIVLLLGGEMGGLIGILLAIPVAGALKVLLPDLIEYYRSTPFYSGLGTRPAFATAMGGAAPTQVIVEGAESEEVAPAEGAEASEPNGADGSAEQPKSELKSAEGIPSGAQADQQPEDERAAGGAEKLDEDEKAEPAAEPKAADKEKESEEETRQEKKS